MATEQEIINFVGEPALAQIKDSDGNYIYAVPPSHALAPTEAETALWGVGYTVVQPDADAVAAAARTRLRRAINDIADAAAYAYALDQYAASVTMSFSYKDEEAEAIDDLTVDEGNSVTDAPVIHWECAVINNTLAPTTAQLVALKDAVLAKSEAYKAKIGWISGICQKCYAVIAGYDVHACIAADAEVLWQAVAAASIPSPP